jgi:[protein-PII] uridylyltransferase
VVRARLSRAEAGLQVAVYLPDQPQLFARICGFFGRSGLSILEAKIHTTTHGYALDTFTVHEPAALAISYRDSIQLVEFELKQALEEHRPLEPPRAGRVSRHLKHFPLTPEVRIFPDDKGTHYILEIVAGDRPGLLAQIAYTLAQANINVVSAKINTRESAPRMPFSSTARACMTSRRCCGSKRFSTSSSGCSAGLKRRRRSAQAQRSPASPSGWRFGPAPRLTPPPRLRPETGCR